MQKYEMMISIIEVSFKTNGNDKAYMCRWSWHCYTW